MEGHEKTNAHGVFSPRSSFASRRYRHVIIILISYYSCYVVLYFEVRRGMIRIILENRITCVQLKNTVRWYTCVVCEYMRDFFFFNPELYSKFVEIWRHLVVAAHPCTCMIES